MSQFPGHRVAPFLLAVPLLLLLSRSARPQAWTPEKGEGYLSLSYTYFRGGDHLFSSDVIDGLKSRGYTADGERWFLGNEMSHTLVAGVDLGLHDRVAVSGSIAFVSSRYEGRAPVNLEIDDGLWHRTLQDASFEVRGMLLRQPLAVTPFLGFQFPVRGYESNGHAAPGRHLRTLLLGANVGWSLSPFLRGAYVEGRYALAFDERNQGVDIERSLTSIEVGYFPTGALLLRFLGSFLTTHDGLDWVSRDPDAPTVHGEGFTSLDSTVSNSGFSRVGIGASHPLWGRLSVYGVAFTTVGGENTIDADFFLLGTSWGFRTPWAHRSVWEP